MSTEYLVDKNKDSIDVFCMGVKSVFMLTCLTSEFSEFCNNLYVT